MTTTKEPSKDFRKALVKLFVDEGLDNLPYLRLSTRVIALCKEMLVPKLATSGVDKSFNVFPQGEEDEGWNACRSELLKQLGE